MKIKILKLLNRARKHKIKVDAILLVSSGAILATLLYTVINNINLDLEKRDKKIIAGIHHSIESLSASQIPSIEHKMYFLPVAVSILSNIGIKISACSVFYLILSYLMWLIFKKSYCRLNDCFYKWIDSEVVCEDLLSY